MTTRAVAATKDSRLAGKLGLAAIAMFGFGYLLIPIYSVICELTGLNGKTEPQRAVVVPASPQEVDLTRSLRVEFVATVNAGLAWKFRAQTPTVTVHPGAITTIAYIAENTGTEAVVGQAVPSVSPGWAARYLHKIECFCFEKQTLEAGEKRVMPVKFYVDPSAPKDLGTITLSYTFFEGAR